SELGKLRSELDLAATTRSELSATAADLDVTRAEAKETGARLQAAIRALDQQRAESERLRMQLTAPEATAPRLTKARATERGHAEPAAEAGRRASEDETPRLPVQGAPSGPHGPAHSEQTHEIAGTPSARPSRPPHRPESQYSRPLNPALRSSRNWIGRVLALIVIIGVIVAIVLVIHSTMP